MTREEVYRDNQKFFEYMDAVYLMQQDDDSGSFVQRFVLFEQHRERDIYVSRDGEFWACYDGEIFHHRTWVELIAILDAADAQFNPIQVMWEIDPGQIELFKIINLEYNGDNYKIRLSDAFELDTSKPYDVYTLQRLRLYDQSVYDRYMVLQKIVDDTREDQKRLLLQTTPLHEYLRKDKSTSDLAQCSQGGE